MTMFDTIDMDKQYTKIGIYCIVCGKLVREEYFIGNIDILVCDECKDAIAWAKEQKRKED